MNIIKFSLILLLIAFFSCKNEKEVLIGFMVPTYEVDRYAIDRDNFTARATVLGAKVLVQNAGNDDKLQIRQAEELINQGVDIIVVIPVNQNTSAAIVRNAHDNGVKVIAYERLIQNSELDYFISFNHYIVGREMANYALHKVPEGNYVIICGDKGDKNAELIEKGNKEVIAPAIQSGKVNLLFSTFIEDWEPASANKIMDQILNTHGKAIDVVLSANDGMAGGIISAVKSHNLDGKVLVTGLDAELPACKRIVQGSQSMTVYKPFKLQATLAADVAVKLARNQIPDVETTYTFNGKIEVPSVSIKPIVVDKANIRQTIIADGFHSEKDIYSEN